MSGRITVNGEATALTAGNVVELLQNEKLRAKLGKGAQRQVFGEFNWGKLVERVKEAYRDDG